MTNDLALFDDDSSSSGHRVTIYDLSSVLREPEKYQSLLPNKVYHISTALTRLCSALAQERMLQEANIPRCQWPIRVHGVKPRLLPGPKKNLFWNVSHDSHTMVVVEGTTEVGVDIMHLRCPPRHKSIRDLWFRLESQFTRSEMEWLEKSSNEKTAINRFYFLWTAKEAYLKFTGSGITRDLSSVEIYPLPEEKSFTCGVRNSCIILRHFVIDNDLCICICTAGETSLNWRTLDATGLFRCLNYESQV